MNTNGVADFDSEIAKYTDFLQQDLDNQFLLAKLGDLHHRAGQFDEAQHYFDKLLLADPEHSPAKSGLAAVCISRHDFEQAEQLFLSMGDLLDASPALQHNLGLALFYQDKWPDALARFEAAMAGGLEDVDTLAYQAYCHHHLGNVARALKFAKLAYEKVPNDQAQGYVSLLQMDKGDFEAAVRTARKALDTNPENVDANVVLGSYLLERQQVDEALPFLSLSLDKDPDNSRAWLGLGLVQMYNQQMPEAIDSISRALSYTPRNPGTIVTLGWAHIANNDLNKAEETFRHAVAVSPSFGEAHGGLATVLALANRDDEAREEVRKSRRLNKGGFGAAFALSILLESGGKHDRAVQVLGHSFLQSPKAGGLKLIEAIKIHAQRSSAKQGPAKLKSPRNL
ncbi:MAG: Flp pilus assembly protein TadD [Halioglobus sp.]|jgi:Flp pilus assembly protein TadD